MIIPNKLNYRQAETLDNILNSAKAYFLNSFLEDNWDKDEPDENDFYSHSNTWMRAVILYAENIEDLQKFAPELVELINEFMESKLRKTIQVFLHRNLHPDKLSTCAGILNDLKLLQPDLIKDKKVDKLTKDKNLNSN